MTGSGLLTRDSLFMMYEMNHYEVVDCLRKDLYDLFQRKFNANGYFFDPIDTEIEEVKAIGHEERDAYYFHVYHWIDSNKL